jgi:hypothetical protein
MVEESEAQEAERDQAPEELTERELDDVAGGNGGGTGLHPLGPPAPGG